MKEGTVGKLQRLQLRRRRIRSKVAGSPLKPRLSVVRTVKHMYAQLVDDTTGTTVVAASTLSPELRKELTRTSNKPAAQAVGKLIAEKAKAKGVTAVVFDRNGRKYHGRVKALADAARESGLVF